MGHATLHLVAAPAAPRDDKHTVVICYSREDREYVERLVAFLHSAGIPVWTDAQIDYGSTWSSVIKHQIENCSAVLPIVTPAAEASSWVQAELAYAQDKSKRILPLLLAGQQLPYLRQTPYEDVRGGRMPGDAFIHLLRDLKERSPD